MTDLTTDIRIDGAPAPCDRLPGHARRPEVIARWPLLSLADIETAGDDIDLLAIRIVERYGISRDWAVREVTEWFEWNTLRTVP